MHGVYKGLEKLEERMVEPAAPNPPWLAEGPSTQGPPDPVPGAQASPRPARRLPRLARRVSATPLEVEPDQRAHGVAELDHVDDLLDDRPRQRGQRYHCRGGKPGGRRPVAERQP